MMWPYFDLVTDRAPQEIAALADEVKSGAKHPMDVKMALATEIIAGFHGQSAAEKAAAEFQRVFRDRQAPADVPVVHLETHATPDNISDVADFAGFGLCNRSHVSRPSPTGLQCAQPKGEVTHSD
jgi:tyrosyl-tRNA synthetase